MTRKGVLMPVLVVALPPWQSFYRGLTGALHQESTPTHRNLTNNQRKSSSHSSAQTSCAFIRKNRRTLLHWRAGMQAERGLTFFSSSKPSMENSLSP
jgi:hypothetical protein